ncbi:hypothetical protein [Crystallibacter degradans]|uniref:hypothetical protein n=1 Tax=Crystallibacter degradans TaxID=2726743 RepID=UPI001475401A|nr:hypothetical protein [Arthrobacter sp. SF27]NMR29296.1 hypothetical protein [Arthrobacter sp. SF27]
MHSAALLGPAPVSTVAVSLAPFRLLRAAAVSATVLCLAAAAHVAGGGTMPATGVVIGLSVLTLLPVTLLAGRKLGPTTMAAILAGSQLALHQAFTVLSTTAVCTEAGHHAYAGAGSLECVAGAASAAGVAAHGPAGHGAAMVGAHMLAAALTGLLLVRGEEAVWALAAWLRPLAKLPSAVVLPIRPAHTAPAPGALLRPRTLCQLKLEPLRGPPAFSFH